VRSLLRRDHSGDIEGPADRSHQDLRAYTQEDHTVPIEGRDGTKGLSVGVLCSAPTKN